jgi:hypothetical protein
LRFSSIILVRLSRLEAEFLDTVDLHSIIS